MFTFCNLNIIYNVEPVSFAHIEAGIFEWIVGIALLFAIFNYIANKAPKKNITANTKKKEEDLYEDNSGLTYDTWSDFVGNMSIGQPTMYYMHLCEEVANKVQEFVHKLDNKENVIDLLQGQSSLDCLETSKFEMQVNQRLGMLLCMDFVKAYDETGFWMDHKLSVSATCMSLIICDICTGERGDLNDTSFVGTYTNNILVKTIDMMESFNAFNVKYTPQKYNLPHILAALDEWDLYNEFYELLAEFLTISSKAHSGWVDEDKLTWILSLIDKEAKSITDSSQVRRPAGGDPEPETPKSKKKKGRKDSSDEAEIPTRSLDEIIAELDELVGLPEVKKEVRKLSHFIEVQRARQKEGLKCTPISYHCVFTGNPGTGKTTVARIVASIYKSLGILKKGQLVETDRSGLVAEYVGQTAVKTNKIIDKALDGVLFIDEAYSLVQGGSSDYGLEAIATLLKRMEDNRDRLVVILAGYKDEMKEFIDANPGLESRFNRYINFEDYDAPELFEIFKRQLSKHEYIATDEALKKIEQRLAHDVATKDENFGNARHVRNLFEKTLENQATRLATAGEGYSRSKLLSIEAEDIPEA